MSSTVASAAFSFAPTPAIRLRSMLQTPAFSSLPTLFAPKTTLVRTNKCLVTDKTSRLLSGQAVRSTSLTMALPSVSTLQKASFMESVNHAERILTENEDSTCITDIQLELIDVMLGTSNGARGFFVTSLSNPEVKIMDTEPLPAKFVNIIKKVDDEQDASAIVNTLIAKNLVMSSSMVIHYSRSEERERMQASKLTAERSRNVLVACLPGNDRLASTVQDMLDALEDENFERQEGFGPFLKKWGYDTEQRRNVARQIRSILSNNR